MKKKLGLALGSGGARGVSHVGFLQALEEAGIKADYVSGCSMGSIVGACYCAGIPMSFVKEKLLGVRLSQIASLTINPIRANGLFRMNRARKMMEPFLGEKQFSDLQTPFSCVAVDVITGKLVELKKGNVLDAIIASSTIPGAFTPASYDGMMLVDGGLLERVPTKEVRKMGAEVVVAVDVLGDLMLKKHPTNIIETLLRCFDIVDTRVTQRKRSAREKNLGLWLEPDLGAMDQYKVKDLEFAYNKGYELGQAHVEEIKRLIGE